MVRARGDNREDSDLDILLDIPPDSKFSLIDLIALDRQIGDDLGLPVGVILRRSLRKEFALRIADDVIDVF